MNRGKARAHFPFSPKKTFRCLRRRNSTGVAGITTFDRKLLQAAGSAAGGGGAAGSAAGGGAAGAAGAAGGGAAAGNALALHHYRWRQNRRPPLCIHLSPKQTRTLTEHMHALSVTNVNI